MNTNTKWFIGMGVVAAVIISLSVIFLPMSHQYDNGFILGDCKSRIDPGKVFGDVQWNPGSFPLEIFVEPDAVEWIPALEEARVRWNLAADGELFGPIQTVRMPSEELHSVRVSRTNSPGYDFNDGEIPAQLVWDSLCKLKFVELRLPGLAGKSMWKKIAVHELGHALGLAHDDIVDSVMFNPEGSIRGRWGMNKITDLDAELLNQHYVKGF